MKKNTLLLFLFGLLFAMPAIAQHVSKKVKDANGYSYEMVTNDPLNARIYTLDNGLKVYLTVNKTKPRIQTCIPVKAGSKNDPADATGLAHYLEHMLFKGTDKYGSLDYEKEAALLAEIEELYEVYRKETDEAKRKEIYAKIDKVSSEAARFAIANEYDKMLASIGATGTNAYTSHEQTVYINDIPSNQLEKWVKIEAERFRKPVFRLFHTELEAVYEEKNISLDRDGSQSWETMLASMFPTHNYGQQTTIGTVEHLKNPSITKIRNYYNTYYVPNNMAICLSGDLDPEATVQMIDKYFGYMEEKEVPTYKAPKEKPVNGPIEKIVTGPDAASVLVGFRTPGRSTREAKVIEVIDMILANSAAGLIDLNLNQKQRVQGAYSYIYQLNDYGVHFLGGRPREGQALEEVKDLLLEQVRLVKAGDFDPELLQAIVNNLQIDQMKQYEENYSRADAFVDAFTSRLNWVEYVEHLSELERVSAEEVVEVANKYYKEDNYAVVYKETGERQNKKKVEKPKITPVEVNRSEQTAFLKDIVTSPSPDIEPLFVNFQGDIKYMELSNGTPLNYVKNEENSLFTMYYLLDMGTDHDRYLKYAVDYLTYLGTDRYSSEEIQKQFYNLGSSYNVYAGRDRVYVYLSGLDKNFRESVDLFEHLLANAQPDEEALTKMLEGVQKERADAKLSKYRILRQGMVSYAKYGKRNPFNNVVYEDQLAGMSSKELIDRVKNLTSFQHKVLYYGPAEAETVQEVLAAKHQMPDRTKPIPEPTEYRFLPTSENKVYFVEYDMVQAEIMWLSRSENMYDPARIAQIAMFNNYYGGGMSSVVFQTIRESKALAYSSYGYYASPSKKGEPYYTTAYIGTQADKLNDALEGMQELLDEIEESENMFNASKEAILNDLRTKRTTRTDILFANENANRLGLSEDPNRIVFEGVPEMTFDDVRNFHNENVAGRPYILLVLGSKKNINLEDLAQYGDVEELSLKDIFGY